MSTFVQKVQEAVTKKLLARITYTLPKLIWGLPTSTTVQEAYQAGFQQGYWDGVEDMTYASSEVTEPPKTRPKKGSPVIRL